MNILTKISKHLLICKLLNIKLLKSNKNTKNKNKNKNRIVKRYTKFLIKKPNLLINHEDKARM